MQQKHITLLAITVFLAVVAFSSPDALAQCKSFVKTSCIPQLAPYIHDGGFHSVMMSEEEEAEIYKTVFSGQQYRLVVCTENSIPGVEFIVTDMRRNILFDNRKNANTRTWDFTSSASQQIKISIRIPKISKQGVGDQELIFGCVGVLFSLREQ